MITFFKKEHFTTSNLDTNALKNAENAIIQILEVPGNIDELNNNSEYKLSYDNYLQNNKSISALFLGSFEEVLTAVIPAFPDPNTFTPTSLPQKYYYGLLCGYISTPNLPETDPIVKFYKANSIFEQYCTTILTPPTPTTSSSTLINRISSQALIATSAITLASIFIFLAWLSYKIFVPI
jgi:hypothetical protein